MDSRIPCRDCRELEKRVKPLENKVADLENKLQGKGMANECMLDTLETIAKLVGVTDNSGDSLVAAIERLNRIEAEAKRVALMYLDQEQTDDKVVDSIEDLVQELKR